MVDGPIALAIILPVFRIQYLRESLESLASQTNQRFRVYIGDDASPDPIQSLVEEFAARLDLRYTRFESNVGGANLISHWRRCVALSENEPWLWMFSDDDVMHPECVSRLYASLSEASTSDVDLYRFQLDQINRHSRRIARGRDHPEKESAVAFLEALLNDRSRDFRAQDHVFSRRIYETSGGFVEFPKAIYSDHATWLRFSATRGVRTISGPRVYWRSHTHGTTSGLRQLNRAEWLGAAGQYLTWLNSYAEARGPEATAIFQRSGLAFYARELAKFDPWLVRQERRAAVRLGSAMFNKNTLSVYLRFYQALLRNRLSRWRRKRRKMA